MKKGYNILIAVAIIALVVMDHGHPDEVSITYIRMGLAAFAVQVFAWLFGPFLFNASEAGGE